MRSASELCPREGCCSIALERARKMGSNQILPWTLTCGKPPCVDAALGNCSVLMKIDKKTSTLNGVTGVPVPKPLTPDDFTDLYEVSCLNGKRVEALTRMHFG